jgi:hypothetical protein
VTPRPARRALSLALAAALAGAIVPAAAAQPCGDAEQRLALVRERLRADARDARVWTWGWGLGFSALAAGQAGLALTRADRGERAELAVGAGKSALGLIPVLLVPVPAARDADAIDARLSASAQPADRCAVVPEAEASLRRNAEAEAFAQSWLAHLGTAAVNGGGLLIVGLGYGRWGTGVAGALVGTLVGEINIFTRPTGALRGRREYEDRWTLAPLVTRGAAGVQIAGHFGY